MRIPLFGHVGDGNFHCEILIRPESKADLEEAKAFNERVVNRALAMEGTCTGEHGIGFGKMRSLRKELGEAVDPPATLKHPLHPENPMNPRKVLVPFGSRLSQTEMPSSNPFSLTKSSRSYFSAPLD